MTTNLSRSPIQIYDASVTSLNEAFRRITEEIDQLQGLRGNQNPIADLNISGTMQTGIVPLPRLQRMEVYADNAVTGAVTLSNPGATSIMTLHVGIVTAGDIILCSGNAHTIKGAVAGLTYLYISPLNGSTAILQVNGSNADSLWIYGLETSFYQQALLDYIQSWSGIFRVTVGGELWLQMNGLSFGSNATINSGQASIYTSVFRGA